MKQLTIILIFNILAFYSFSQGYEDNPAKKKQEIIIDKNIKGEIIGGVNITQVDGDEVYGFKKVGLNAGVGVIFPLFHRFSLTIETLYNEKGSYARYPQVSDTSGRPYYSLTLNYLDVPVLLQFEDRHTWTFGLGFSWGRLVTFQEIIRGIDQDWSKSTFPYHRSDFDILADVRFRIWKHLKFNFRYAYSLTNIGSRHYKNAVGAEWDRKMYNNVITVRLLYLFNEKYLPPVYKRVKKEKKAKKSK